MRLSEQHLKDYGFYLNDKSVPYGWEIVSVEDISFAVTDGTHKTPDYQKSGVRFISIKNIRPYQQVNWNSYEKYISRYEHEELIKRCHPEFDDILFPRIGTLGFAKRIDFTEEVSIFVGLGLIKPIKKYINPKFMEYYMNTPYIAQLSQRKANGTGRKTLPLEESRRFPFPLVPLKEQQRIVEKLEELFSELDKGVENLQTVQRQLRIYRQTLLKHAFEGKLTAQWREENKDKLESADQLLERIKSEREAHYQQQLKTWEQAVNTWETADKFGKKPIKPKVPKHYSPLSKETFSDLSELPHGWAWDKLGWMTCGVEYGTSAKSSENGDIPVLRMGNIQNGKFDWSDLVYTNDKLEIAEYSLIAGDVLFNRTNSPELVGKTAIYRGEQPAIFAGYLIRVNHISTVIDSQFLNLFLNSFTSKKYGNTVKTDGVNQSNINGDKLSNYPFPYCSLFEQKEITRILEEKLSILDKTEEDVIFQLQKAEALRQAILKRAFSGQLVPQDSSDEPASVLLERIKAEKATQSKPQKAKRPKSKNIKVKEPEYEYV